MSQLTDVLLYGRALFAVRARFGLTAALQRRSSLVIEAGLWLMTTVMRVRSSPIVRRPLVQYLLLKTRFSSPLCPLIILFGFATLYDGDDVQVPGLDIDEPVRITGRSQRQARPLCSLRNVSRNRPLERRAWRVGCV